MHHPTAAASQYLQEGFGITTNFFRSRKRHGEHIPIAIEQVPGNHIPVTAVVALPREDQSSLRTAARKTCHNFFGNAPPGVFHEHNPGDADVLDGSAVNCLHLFGRQYFHNASKRTVATA